MTEMNEFRLANEFEKSIIRKSLSKISRKFEMFIKQFEDRLYISFNRTISNSFYPSIYILSTNNSKFIQKLEVIQEITSAGLYFGFIKKENFLISLEGTEFLVSRDYLSKDQMLIIDNNGEKSVLYGNDIKKENILKSPSNFDKDDFIVIYNIQNELIAIGRWVINEKTLINLNPDDKIALNLVDKGYYLRKNQ